MKIKNKLFGRTLSIAGIAIVTILALLPAKYIIFREISHGLYGHFLAFFFLSFIISIYSTMNIVKQMISLLIIGGMIEVVQHFSGYRDPSFQDILYDSYGIGAYYILFIIFKKIFSKTN